MKLFFTDVRLLAQPLPAIEGVDLSALTASGAIALATRQRVPEQMPFILSADGAYLTHVNRFLRMLPMLGVRSPNSWAAYANDILVWLRFLEEHRGTSVLLANVEDARAFHAARRFSDNPAHVVGASTWNRSVAALVKFYDWAADESLVAANPFLRAAHWSKGGGAGGGWAAGESGPRSGGGGQVLAVESSTSQHDARFLSMPRYRLFVDTGLRGRLPGGREDPSWRGRNGNRNGLFAELLVTTGMRREEAASLLVAELPELPADPAVRAVPLVLGKAITKGQRGRTVYLPVRVLRALRAYAEIEWDNAVAAGRSRGSYGSAAFPLRGRLTGTHTVRLDGEARSTRLAQLRPRDRHRLLLDTPAGAAPAALWLTEQGLPVSLVTWDSVFARASQRCATLRHPVHASPHTLRHTFAVHMLSHLIRQQLGRLWAGEGEEAERHGSTYRQVVSDPLQRLQRLLGHSQIATTYLYLDDLVEAREIVEAAVARFAAEIGAAVPATDRGDHGRAVLARGGGWDALSVSSSLGSARTPAGDAAAQQQGGNR